jgi:hypothetical protein
MYYYFILGSLITSKWMLSAAHCNKVFPDYQAEAACLVRTKTYGSYRKDFNWIQTKYKLINAPSIKGVGYLEFNMQQIFLTILIFECSKGIDSTVSFIIIGRKWLLTFY